MEMGMNISNAFNIDFQILFSSVQFSHSVMSDSFVIPWTVAHQTPLSMGFPRQYYWSGLPFPSPGDLLNPRVKPGSLTLQADSLPSEPPGRATEGRAIYKREHLKSLPLWVYIQVTVEKYTINKIKM